MTQTVEVICEAYLRHKVKNHKSRQAQIIATLIQDFGLLFPQNLTPKRIAAWRAKRPSFQDSSARRELGALISAVRWGARHKMIDPSHMPSIDLPPPGQARSVWMTISQEEEFWLHAQDWGQGTRVNAKSVQIFTSLALDTAARKGAILRLDWPRVKLDQGLIDYREPGTPKTNKRRIPIPINSRLKPVLIRAWAAAPKDAKGQAMGLVVGTHNIDRAFAEFADTVGFGWVTPQVCRHTWASLAVQGGMHMALVAKMLGDTLKTTEDNYAHLAPSHLTNVADWRFQGAPTP
jgi:integrase